MNRMTWISQSPGRHGQNSTPIMVKLGGAAIDRAGECSALFAALRNLHKISAANGGGVILVHGGGAAVDRRLERLGLQSQRRQGIRITPPEHIDEVVAELAGSVNKRLVAELQQHSISAVGLCLSDGAIASCEKASGYDFDPGCVGEVRGGDARLVHLLLSGGFMPVLSSIGFDEHGHPLNINADDAASALAGLLGCRELILMTDVPGVCRADGTIIAELSADEVEALIQRGEITGGMIPKVRAAVKAANDAGVPVTIAGWNDPQSLHELGRGLPTGTRVKPRVRTEDFALSAFAATPWSDVL